MGLIKIPSDITRIVRYLKWKSAKTRINKTYRNDYKYENYLFYINTCYALNIRMYNYYRRIWTDQAIVNYKKPTFKGYLSKNY